MWNELISEEKNLTLIDIYSLDKEMKKEKIFDTSSSIFILKNMVHKFVISDLGKLEAQDLGV